MTGSSSYSGMFLSALAAALCLLASSAAAFSPLLPSQSVSASVSASASASSATSAATTTLLSMAAVPPSTDSTVGIFGRGYVSVLLAKLAAVRGYTSFLIAPDGELETIKELLVEDDDEDGGMNGFMDRLTIVDVADLDKLESKLMEMDALLLASDYPSNPPASAAVIDLLLKPERSSKCKRVVSMSRNLNGSGMGFLVKASRASANAQVWDNSNPEEYQAFEASVKAAAAKLGGGADAAFFRAGTLKGGACGEVEADTFAPQYLSSKFYDQTKKDIISWNLLFDCNVRGVRLEKGDVLKGPGGKAVFVANSPEVNDGDTGRTSIAEAMVRCLEREGLQDGADFGVATAEGRVPPSDEEWNSIFAGVGC